MTHTSVQDIPRTAHVEPTITIYGPEACSQCESAMRLFDASSITYQKITITPGDANYLYITEQLGYTSAPVIIVTFSQLDRHRDVHWGGHRMDMLTAVRALIRSVRETTSTAHQPDGGRNE